MAIEINTDMISGRISVWCPISSKFIGKIVFSNERKRWVLEARTVGIELTTEDLSDILARIKQLEQYNPQGK